MKVRDVVTDTLVPQVCAGSKRVPDGDAVRLCEDASTRHSKSGAIFEHNLSSQMANNAVANATDEEKLKAALWYSIGQTVDALSMNQSINGSPKFIAGLSELVYDRINAVAVDLEAFAKHADRTVVNTKDVVLLGRHNDVLKSILQDHAKSIIDKEAKAK